MTIGGTATVTADARGATNFESLTGGTADGGSANIDTWGGTISIAGATKVSANALADDHSHVGVDGRDSFAGDAEVLAGGGGAVTIGGKLDITANAFGTNSLRASEGTGGSAYGGDTRLVADGGSISVAGNTNLSAGAIGGKGNIGGAAQGGGVELTSDSWNSETLGSVALHGLGLFANADPGQGDGGGQALPSGTGGVVVASARGGSLAADAVTIRANGTSAGGTIAVGSLTAGQPGSVAFDSLSAQANSASGTAGTIMVGAEGGSITDIGQGDLRASGADGGRILLAAGSCDCNGGEGELALAAEAEGFGGGIKATDLFLLTSGSLDLLVSGGSDIAASGKVLAFGGQFASMVGDNSGSSIRVHEINLHAGTIVDNANIVADIVRLAATTSNMTVGDLSANDLIELNAAGDIIAGDLSAGNSIQVAAVNNVTLGDLDAPNVRAVAVIGKLDVGDVQATAATLTAVAGLQAGDIDASDKVFVASAGDMVVGEVTATNLLQLFGSHDIETGNLKAATVTIATGGDISVQDVKTSGEATFTALGQASFFGVVDSPTITVTSRDIEIADGASLGVTGVTNLVTLNAVSHGLPIMLGDGGEPAAGQYQLSEDGDIHSTAVVLNAVAAKGSEAPDVQIFDAKLDGSASSGGGTGSITINTDGNVFVLGDVEFINAAATDKLSINAGSLIQVNTGSGKISMTDTAGKLAGTLELNADNVWVGDGSLLDQLKGNVNFAGRDTALATNNSSNSPDGFVRAGTITARIANSFLVQNSGTAKQFAGVDAGDGGLGITSTSATPVTVIAYGRQTLTGGSTITNEDFLGSVALIGTGGFTTDSAVNGCPIGGGCHVPDLAFNSSSVLGGVSSDDGDNDDDKDKGDDSDDGSGADPALKLINTLPVNLDHHIDDPVTSGGDVVIGGGPGGGI